MSSVRFQPGEMFLPLTEVEAAMEEACGSGILSINGGGGGGFGGSLENM